MRPEFSPPTLMTTAGVAPPPAFHHEPVLLAEVLSFVPPAARLLVDCTLGGGGHAEALLNACPRAELFGCDRDAEALAAARARLEPFAARLLLRQAPFAGLGEHLLAGSVDFMLADLGASSHQFDSPRRGFSFTRAGPLDMRMDAKGGGSTAARLVNEWPAEKLAALLRTLGEERFARRIAEAIVAARREQPLATTEELADLVARTVPARFHKRGFHPATRVFQALRMEVNGELLQLAALLDVAPHLLAPGGRLVVIAFHSLEDRPVKERFHSWESPCRCPPSMPYCVCGKLPLGRRLTKKPVTATPGEAERNPRSRGAKLRAFEMNPQPSAQPEGRAGRPR